MSQQAYPYEYVFKTPPYKHQLEVWERSRDAEFFALFMDMGTGKSKVALDTAAWLYDQGKIDALFILAKKGSYMDWVDAQIPTHLPDRIPRYVAWWKAGAGARHAETYAELGRFRNGLKILVMNTEALAFDKGYAFAERFANSTRCLGVLDESTAIGNPKALRTKAALRLRRFLRYRRVLTGTPAAGGVVKLYSQGEFLCQGLLGHRSFYSFRNEFCVLADMTLNVGARLLQFKRVVGPRNLPRLKERMLPWSATVRKEDCLDLPPKVYETYRVELTAEQRRVYEELRERSIAELAGQVVTVDHVLTKLLRLQQVVCGYLPGEDGSLLSIKHGRLDALMELLEETSGKVIVWSRFVRDIEAITQALIGEHGKESVATYYGGTGQEERREALEGFQRGGVRFLVGNQQTAGYGLTLTAAATVVYYANSFDLELRLQSEDRCHRIGQTRSVTYLDLLSPGTVDEKIVKALRDKKKISDIIMSPAGWMEML